jgi:hypothetical protein
MTNYFIDPEDLLSDFLRVHVTDPQDRAEDLDSNTFTATASQQDFSITPTIGSVSCVTSVTVDGTTKAKWCDYHWDYQNSKIIFYKPLVGSEEVIANFKQGSSNWIYSDFPDDKLALSSWPRISLFTIGGSGKRLGQTQAPTESSPVFQIDVWTKDGQVLTIDSKKYSNHYLGRYIALQVSKAFEQHEDDLFILYNYNPTGNPRTAPYSQEYQAHHTVLEVNLKALKLGRIEVS